MINLFCNLMKNEVTFCKIKLINALLFIYFFIKKMEQLLTFYLLRY